MYCSPQPEQQTCRSSAFAFDLRQVSFFIFFLDARAGTPDARAGTPDARGGTPDARAGTPDARAGTPDSRARLVTLVVVKILPAVTKFIMP